MSSPAQNKAIDNYRKRSVRQMVVRFYPKDQELYRFVKDRGGTTYLKELASREMKRGE